MCYKILISGMIVPINSVGASGPLNWRPLVNSFMEVLSIVSIKLRSRLGIFYSDGWREMSRDGAVCLWQFASDGIAVSSRNLRTSSTIDRQVLCNWRANRREREIKVKIHTSCPQLKGHWWSRFPRDHQLLRDQSRDFSEQTDRRPIKWRPGPTEWTS